MNINEFESIGTVNQRLTNWIKSVLPNTEVSYVLPASSPNKDTVNLYFINILPSRTPNTLPGSPLQITLQYILTVWNNDPLVEHDYITQLAFAALETDSFETVFDPFPVSFWNSLNIPTRPHLSILTSLSKPRRQSVGKRVEHPMVLQSSFKQQCSGVVVDKIKNILPGVRIEIPHLAATTTTGPDGTFIIEATPALNSNLKPEDVFNIFYKNTIVTHTINKTVSTNGQTFFYIQLLEV